MHTLKWVLHLLWTHTSLPLFSSSSRLGNTNHQLLGQVPSAQDEWTQGGGSEKVWFDTDAAPCKKHSYLKILQNFVNDQELLQIVALSAKVWLDTDSTPACWTVILGGETLVGHLLNKQSSNFLYATSASDVATPPQNPSFPLSKIPGTIKEKAKGLQFLERRRKKA